MANNASIMSALVPYGIANGGQIRNAISLAQQGENKANKANEARYNQGLGILQTANTQAGGFIQNALSGIANNGVAAGNRINLQEQNNAGQTAQSTISRGLNNTTISDALQRGVQRDANDARLSLQESLNNQRSNINLAQANQTMGGANNIANFIAARNDNGPDLGLISGLIQGAASDATGAQRYGSVTRNSLPGAGGSSSGQMGDPFGSSSSSGGGGSSGPAGYGGGYYQMPSSQGAISTALSPTVGGTQGPIANSLGGASVFMGAGSGGGYGTATTGGDAGSQFANVGGVFNNLVPSDQKGSVSIAPAEATPMSRARAELTAIQQKNDLVYDSTYRAIERKYGLPSGSLG